jgi:hypothetical protein
MLARNRDGPQLFLDLAADGMFVPFGSAKAVTVCVRRGGLDVVMGPSPEGTLPLLEADIVVSVAGAVYFADSRGLSMASDLMAANLVMEWDWRFGEGRRLRCLGRIAALKPVDGHNAADIALEVHSASWVLVANGERTLA